MLLPHLGGAGRPEAVLVNLERLAALSSDPAEVYRQLAGNPRAVEVLAGLFSGSQFLSEILLRSPEGLPWLADPHWLAALKNTEGLLHEAAQAAE